MGESGILNSFLAILSTEGVPEQLMVHALRLIGNACADTGEMFLQFFRSLLIYTKMKIGKGWLIRPQ
jgi:hypothetical protein